MRIVLASGTDKTALDSVGRRPLVGPGWASLGQERIASRFAVIMSLCQIQSCLKIGVRKATKHERMNQASRESRVSQLRVATQSARARDVNTAGR